MKLLPDLLSCAVCLPDQSTDIARAANMMLMFMVVVVFLILGLFIKIMFNFARREREHQESLNNQ
jgi:heme/copper-type cytochrome/quinol oxidase subunit 2